MNKKVLQTLIYILWAVIIASVVLKIWFPQHFVIAVQNETVLSVGNYIDTHAWLYYILTYIFRFVTYYLYTCACCQVWSLHWKHLIATAIVAGATLGIAVWNPTVGGQVDCVAMVLLPCALGANYKNAIAVYAYHVLGQLALIMARSAELYAVGYNFATSFIFTFDMYIWLVVYYLYANKYKESNGLWDLWHLPSWKAKLRIALTKLSNCRKQSQQQLTSQLPPTSQENKQSGSKD